MSRFEHLQAVMARCPEDTSWRGPLRVCIAIAGSDDRSFEHGVDLGAVGLAEALARAGHQVTILLLSAENDRGQNGLAEWRGSLEARGVKIASLPAKPPVPIGAYAHPSLAYRAFLWLREGSFDVVHFPDRGGYAYYSMLARRQGLAFPTTLFCIRSDGPTLWAQSAGLAPLGSMEDLTADFMERQSLALADAVVGSTCHILSWMETQGWNLPKDAFVCGTIPPHPLGRQIIADQIPIREIVFLVHLERQRELDLFFNALDSLALHSSLMLQVTFLNTMPISRSRESLAYVERRLRRWRWPSRVITDCAWGKTIKYLQARACVAVLGMSINGTPSRVVSLIAAGVPVLIPAIHGIPEFVAEEDRPRTCFDLWPASLAERIETMLQEGPRPTRAAVGVEETERTWVRWHELLRKSLKETMVTPPLVTTTPLVSVCMVHHNRPRYLAQALTSIRQQDYSQVEVVLVDDGSTEPEATRYLDQLEEEFASRGWRIIRQDNRFPGAARNTAVKHSRGEYVLFMDDDNYAKPNEISTFVSVAKRTEADVLTCFSDNFAGDEPPDPGRPPLSRAPALGPAVAFGVFECGFGNTNALVRREAFDRIGGFTEDYGVVAEDHEFLARAVLSGLRLEAIPEALWWYRVHGESILNITDRTENQVRALRPYLDAVHPELRALLFFTLGRFLWSPAPPRGLVQLLYALRGATGWLRVSNRMILLRRFFKIVRTRGLRAALGAVTKFAQGA